MKNDHFFEMSLTGEDRENVTEAVNMGIDSRLTGFTRSEFKQSTDRLFCWIHTLEMEVLIRRLHQLWIFGNDEAGLLADNIVLVHYGKEVI